MKVTIAVKYLYVPTHTYPAHAHLALSLPEDRHGLPDAAVQSPGAVWGQNLWSSSGGLGTRGCWVATKTLEARDWQSLEAEFEEVVASTIRQLSDIAAANATALATQPPDREIVYDLVTPEKEARA